MKIENLRLERMDDRRRAIATVIWEDCARPPQDIFYETTDEFAEDLSCNAEAFLIGSVLPAMRLGEERVAIDVKICPEIVNGLATAMGWICLWYGPPRRPVQIESKQEIRWPLAPPVRRTGSFLSGGIDSLATLRANRLDFPPAHPKSIKDCIIVHGFDIGAFEEGEREIEAFERAVNVMQPVAKDAQVNLIPVYTNVRHLYDDVEFWMHEFHGAALSSVAHMFSNRLSTMLIASCYAIPDQQPWGAHPLLDPNYSSSELEIRHDGLRFSRFEKARLVAGWDVALQNLRVCWRHPTDTLNCGKCDKCIWTMLELLAIGKLADTRAFPENDVSKELLETIRIKTKFQDAFFYRELIGPLNAIGRNDLTSVLEAKSAEFHKYQAWKEEQAWKGAVKRFDRRYLGTSLFKGYKNLREFVKRA